MSGVLIAFIIFVLFPGIILGFILLSRYLRYKETQTMIEHGITPPQPQPPPMMPIMPPAIPPQAPPMMPPPYMAPAPPPMSAMPPMPPPMAPPMPVMPRPMPPQRPSRAQLTWGLVLTGVGLALTLALWPIGLFANSAAGEGGGHFPLGLGPWMLGGFIPLFVGLALILAHVISQPERNNLGAGAPAFMHGEHHAPPPLAPLPSAYTAPAAPPPPGAETPPAVGEPSMPLTADPAPQGDVTPEPSESTPSA